jgi:hypothetical protein
MRIGKELLNKLAFGIGDIDNSSTAISSALPKSSAL